jgi:effector-binding domain-containing protein
MIDTPHIVKTAGQSTAMIHLTVPRAEIRNVMGPGYLELMNTLRAQGITPAGPWLNRHLKNPGETFDFELSVPVARPVTPAGRVTNGQLPAVTAARTIYRGPYEGLPEAWKLFDAWIVAQERKAAPWLWETYVTDPSANPDPATWQTELTRPLAD